MATPEGTGEAGGYSGRHRTPSRRRLFLKVGIVLGAVAVVLTAVGVVITVTMSGDDKGVYADGKVADLCPFVDSAPLADFAVAEKERSATRLDEPRPAAVGCTVLMAGEPDSKTYLTVELRASMRVYAGVNDAMAGYSGTMDWERSKQREPELLSGVAQQAGFVTAAAQDEGTEYRLRARDSNATIDVTMFARGLSADEVSNDQVKDALVKIGTNIFQGVRSAP